jgi:hypothetical protein
VEGHPDKYFPGNEAGDTDGDGQRIADETRSVPEAYLNLERLTANGAMFVHLHHMFKIIRIMMDVQVSLAATGTFIGQDAAEQAGMMFDGGMCDDARVVGMIMCFHDPKVPPARSRELCF